MRNGNLLLMMLCASLLFTIGCSKDDPKDEVKSGNVLVTILQPNPDGMSGAQYMQLIDDKELLQSISLSNAIPIPYGGSMPQVYGNDVFVFPSYFGESANELQKFTVTNGALSQREKMTLPTNNGATNIVMVSKDKAYLSLAGLGQIIVFNPTTMTKISEIDLTSLAYEDNNPDPGAMIYRDGYLFVGLNQLVGGYATSVDYAQSDVAIINTENNTIEKMISTSKNNLSQPTRAVDYRSIFMDEKGDIYINCISGYGFLPGHNTGFLRIKKGELEFDETFNWAIPQTEITGDDKKGIPGAIASVYYVGNGIAYGYINVPAYYPPGEGFGGAIAYVHRAVKFDLYNKTITMLKGLELSNGYAVMVSNLDDDVVFANASQTNKGIYIVDQLENSVISDPIMKTDYNVMGWTQMEE